MEPRFSPARRSEAGLVIATLLWFGGNYSVVPFLPLYVYEIGDLTLSQAALWSGIAIAVTPLVSGLAQPLWGRLADRIGRKLLLQRSLAGFSVSLGLMAVAGAPWHLAAIRAGMGIFGGFTGLSVAMVSATKDDRLVKAIGRLNAARVAGMGIGPLVGGLIASYAGYRTACLASMSFALVALLAVSLLVFESQPNSEPARSVAGPPSKRLLAGAVLAPLVAVAAVRLIERTFDPIVPLLASSYHDEIEPATAAAIISSLGLLAAGVAATTAGWLKKGLSLRGGLVTALAAAAPGLAAIVLASSWTQLAGLRILVGLCLGFAMTFGYALIARETPAELHGFTFGIAGSATSYGAALGSLIAGLTASVSLGLVFIIDAALLGLCATACAAARWRRK